MTLKTIEALRGLYVALGGDLADVVNINNTPDMLMAISTVASAAASELPVVKAADNGKVLKVVEGKWAKADLPEELPAVTGDDNGKVLKVVEGEWTKATAGSTYSETTLAEGRIEGGVPTTLSDSITDYDAFYLVALDTEARNIVSPLIPVNNISFGATQYVSFGVIDPTQSPARNYDAPFVFTDASTFELEKDGYLTEIVGIKF